MGTGPVITKQLDLADWSGRRDLNPRPSPWQGDALPLSYSRLVLFEYIETYVNGQFTAPESCPALTDWA